MLRQLVKYENYNARILRKTSSFFKHLMIFFIVMLFSIYTPVYAQCLSKDELSPYILLQVHEYSQQSQHNSKLVNASSGVLISDEGLILTDLSLLKDDYIEDGKDNSIHLKNDIHVFALKESPNNIITNKNERFELTPIKIHKRRKLLLLEINDIAGIKKMNLKKAKIMEVNRNSEKLKSCTVAYEENNPNEYVLKSKDDFELSNFDGRFLFKLDGFNFTGESTWGGPVFMDNTDQLIGIISSWNGDFKHMIPIEFADSLLPQIFLSDLKEKFNPVERSYREHSISWEVVSSGTGNVCVKFDKRIDGGPYLTKRTDFKFIFTLKNNKDPDDEGYEEKIEQVSIDNTNQPDKKDVYDFQKKSSQFCLNSNGMAALTNGINEFSSSHFIKSVKLVIRPQVSWYSETAENGDIESLRPITKDIDREVLCNILTHTSQEAWLEKRCEK